jgi:hypothetical protein
MEVAELDRALMANCSRSWRKVARVVGTTMMVPPFKSSPLPDVCYATRVVELVRQGKLEADGNLNYMRYSEVRLAQEPSAQVGAPAA